MVPEESRPMTLEEWRAEVNKPQEGGPHAAFIKMEIERANLVLNYLEEQQSSSKSTSLFSKGVVCFAEWMIRRFG